MARFLKFGALGIRSLVKALGSDDLYSEEIDDLNVDLAECQWIEPIGFVALSAMIADHVSRGGTGNVSYPAGGVGDYLKRMDFFRVHGIDTAESFRRGEPAGRFVPVTKVAGGAVQKCSAELVRCLAGDDPEMERILDYVIGEILDNAHQHSGTKIDPMIHGQRWPTKGRSQIAVADVGCGIRDSFAGSPLFDEIKSDADAIQLALRPFVTSTGGGPYAGGRHNMGVGLTMVKGLAMNSKGRMLLASGGAAYLLESTGTESIIPIRSIRGTLFALELARSRVTTYDQALESARASLRPNA